MSNFKTLTDHELTEAAHDLARRVSYYNAAEGNWSQERVAREAVVGEFRAALKEMNERGLVFENKGYLL